MNSQGRGGAEPPGKKNRQTKEAKMGNNGSRIPEGFWTTKPGRELCTTMHDNAWDALACVTAQINGLTKASAETTDAAIKAEIERAKAKLVAAREACGKAMEILKDTAF